MDLTLTELKSRRNIWTIQQFNKRFNPNHDAKDGKFTSKVGGHSVGAYKPGAWSQSKPEAEILGREGMLRKELSPELQEAIVRRDGPNGLRMLAESMVRGTAYRNGPHSVTFASDALSPEQQGKFLGEVDFMEANFPIDDPINLVVSPSHDFSFGTGGETFLGTGSIRLNEHVFHTHPGAILTPFGHWQNGMPVAANVPGERYVLAHEWGHAVDVPPNVALKVDGLTRYGHENAAEAYAEAFAEWSLTRGQTTNPAAMEYARVFKWGERWPLS